MPKLPKSFYSWTTIGGAVLAVVSLFIIIFLFIISALFPGQVSQYLGIFTYIVMPVFLIIGLLLIPIGTWRKFKNDKKELVQRESKFPKIDLNDPAQRMIVFIFVLGSTLFVLFTALGSYEAFHYTESTEFCGTLCHKVMNPEYTAYQQSPHSRLSCVECHVGSGADWYVKSKLSGLHQVYAVLTHTYPIPIASPVHDLRPARGTCEECHWPGKFYDRKLIQKKYYLADDSNTEWELSLLMKTGPAHKAGGQRSGIHWHVNPNVKIEYISALANRTKMALVKYTNLLTGKVLTYKDTADEYTSKQLDTLEHRVVDCIDCHNRPSHDFISPVRFIDAAISEGKIPKHLPDIKMVTMDILYNNTFPDNDSADRFISSKILSYYKENFPALYDSSKALIDTTIANVQIAFNEHVFSDMKASWAAHPNFIGHLEVNGCFRCHNGSFVNQEGGVISKNCDICHEIRAQGTPGHMEYAGEKAGLEFKHPVDIDGDWKTTNCVECHSNLF